MKGMIEKIGPISGASLCSLSLAALAATSSAAESTNQTAQAAAKLPPGQLENGLTSLTKLAPPITRVSDYSGGPWERNTMIGDPGGFRSAWYEKGFSLDMALTQIYQGVASGGSLAGNGKASYNGLFEANAYLDTAKLGWWSGGLFAATLQSSWGNPLSSEVGSISPVNMTPLWPVPFDNTTRVTEYYMTQALPHETVMIVGRVDATNFLDTNPYANIPEAQFFNGSLNNDLLWGNMLTFSTYAALFVIPINERFSVATGAWTPGTQPDDYGGDWNDWAAVVNPIFNYHIGEKPGIAQITFAYSSKDTAPFDNPRFAPNPLTDVIGSLPGIPTENGNWLATFNLAQHLWTPEGSKEDYAGGTQDFVNNPPGLGLFYRFGYMPDDRNSFNMTMSGGLGARGVIPGRPNDRMGIGAYGMFASGEFKDSSLVLDALLDDEVGAEVYYNFAITPWVQLSVDVQRVHQGLTASRNAWVVGSRLYFRF